MSLSIKEAANRLGVTTVRVHGLLNEGKLSLEQEPLVYGGRPLKAVTEESVEAYLAARTARANDLAQRKEAKEKGEVSTARGGGNRHIRKVAKQYILTLLPSEVAEIEELGIDIRPKHGHPITGLAEPAEPITATREDVEKIYATAAQHERDLDRDEEFMADDDEDLLAENDDLVENREGFEQAAEEQLDQEEYDSEGRYIPYNERVKEA